MAIPELMIDDPIGSGFCYEGITAKSVNQWLRDHRVAEILVRINSPGGNAFEGHSIYSALRGCGARVIVEVDALAASAASIIAMAGDEIRVKKGAMIMIHESWGTTQGPAADHIKRAELLTKINGEMADIYSARTGLTRETCLEMMNAETWMGAEEAMKLGFCDRVLPAKGRPDQKQQSKASASLFSMYKRAPTALTQAFEAPPPARLVAITPLSELANGFTARLGDR